MFGIPSRPSADSPSQDNYEQSHDKEYMEISDRYVLTSAKLKACQGRHARSYSRLPEATR